MSRRRNIDVFGHAHMLTFSTYRRYPFLTRPRVCRWLVEAIETTRRRHTVDIWAYVFMPDHVHAIVCPRSHRTRIADIRKSIKLPVAKRAMRWLE